MCYPKDLCLFLLNHTDVIEKCSLTEYVETELFKAVNHAIDNKLGLRTPWKRRLGLVTGDDDGNEETTFAPLHWPTKVGGDEFAFFRLWENESDINEYWLSHALGLNNGKLCFEFRMKPKTGGPSTYRIKKAVDEFYSKNECLKNDGFVLRQNGTIYLPFIFDVKTMIKEFPNFKETILPVNDAFDKIAKHLPLFDGLVKEVFPINYKE